MCELYVGFLKEFVFLGFLVVFFKKGFCFYVSGGVGGVIKVRCCGE